MISFCCCCSYCYVFPVFVNTILMIHADCSHSCITGCYCYTILILYYRNQTELCS